MAEEASTAAQEPKRLSRKFHLHDELDAFVAQSVKDFPQLKDKFILYSAPTNSWHGSMDGLEAEDNQVIQKVLQLAKARKEKAAAFARKRNGLFLIALVEDPGYTDRNFDHILRTLQHELGHLVAPAAIYYENNHTYNFQENVVTVFSTLRTKQLYPDVDVVNRLLGEISQERIELIFRKDARDLSLITSIRLLEFLEKELHLDQMTPVQIANFSYRMALQYALPQEKLDELTVLFTPVADLYQKIRKDQLFFESVEKTFHMLADVMIADHGDMSYVVYNMGYGRLYRYLEGSLRLQGIQIPPPQGEYWEGVRQKIKERDESHKPTAQDLLNRKLDYLQALGKFDAAADQDPNKIIDPVAYESPENQDLIKKNRAVYMRQVLQPATHVAAAYKSNYF